MPKKKCPELKRPKLKGSARGNSELERQGKKHLQRYQDRTICQETSAFQQDNVAIARFNGE